MTVIEQAYADRWAAEAELPAIHQRWLELTATLHQERSDKDDDIGFADAAISSAAKAVAAAKDANGIWWKNSGIIVAIRTVCSVAC